MGTNPTLLIDGNSIVLADNAGWVVSNSPASYATTLYASFLFDDVNGIWFRTG